MESVVIGVSPAGSTWICRPRDNESPESFAARVAVMREQLAKLTARAASQAEPTIESLRDKYESARRRVLRLKGEANKDENRRRYGSTYNFPGYMEASSALDAARKALRTAEKKEKKTA